jgi:gliding motility-associated-like protein
VPRVVADATNDTSVVVNQPLQLFASGAPKALWTPSRGLNDVNSLTPVAILDADIKYLVRIFTPEGCDAYDSVRVRVFKTNPDIFVPSVFSPNHDGKNDIFKPIPVGITNLNFFRVFNRNGLLLYSTTVVKQGWDGTYNGVEQNQGTYVWEVEGVDFTGKVIYKKGYAVLLR